MSKRRQIAPGRAGRASKASGPAAAGNAVSVRLAKPHQHAGQSYNPGDTIEVSEPEARWLFENGIAVDQ